MATRDVQLRLTSTGLDKLVAQFTELGKKLDTIIGKLDDISRKLDVLGAKRATPSVSVDGIDQALAKIALLKAALDDVSSTRATARAGVRGGSQDALSRFMFNSLYRPATGGTPFTAGMTSDLQAMLARDRVFGGLGAGRGFEYLYRAPGAFTAGDQGVLRATLGRETALAGGNIDRGVFNMLGNWGRLGNIGGFIGGPGRGGIVGAGAAAAGGIGQAGAAVGRVPWAPIGIGGGIGIGASLVPALVPLLLGGMAGGAGLFGAFKMASNANTNLTGLQSALQSTQQTYQQDLATGASPQQTIYDYQQMNAAQRAVNVYQKQAAPQLNLYNAQQNLGALASGTFSSAIMSNATRVVQDRGPGHGASPTGSHQVQVGGTSFMAGITKTMGQVGSFASSPAMQQGLGELFRASLPFINTFVKVLEDFARTVGPQVVKMLEMFRPYLPIIRQGFKQLALGVMDFLKVIGPEMKDGATIFKGVMIVIRGGLIALGVGIDIVTKIVLILGRAFVDTGKAAIKAWDWIAQTFDQVVKGAKIVIGDLENAGRQMIDGFIHGIESRFGAVIRSISRLGHNIVSTISSVLHIFSPSRVMFGLGGHIGEGLALGIDSTHGRVMASAANLARGIPGSVGSSASAGGARPLPIDLTLHLSDNLMQVISKQIRAKGGDPRVLIRKVRVA